ncbi:hypothetical protein BGZ61DRAFT_27507 [Ilyonectria robusta]|uniref:uncharacterized protein n=1 Tax=Ilyonectria robusta TaxID=1079257 RepID=UPI001E8D2C0A|nr:uncharacterized protein BGZ61DRAFT_27507 [Ilyonectria robusta]KAH8738075.1 hypothetical protein BGZ61DRAFT_27507 [Ilyonectria robusta]
MHVLLLLDEGYFESSRILVFMGHCLEFYRITTQAPSPGLAIHGELHRVESLISMNPSVWTRFIPTNKVSVTMKEKYLTCYSLTEQPIGSLPATLHCCHVLAMPSLPDIGTTYEASPALRLCPEQSGVVCLSTCASTIGDSGSCETGNLV